MKQRSGVREYVSRAFSVIERVIQMLPPGSLRIRRQAAAALHRIFVLSRAGDQTMRFRLAKKTS